MRFGAGGWEPGQQEPACPVGKEGGNEDAKLGGGKQVRFSSTDEGQIRHEHGGYGLTRELAE